MMGLVWNILLATGVFYPSYYEIKQLSQTGLAAWLADP